MNITHRFNNLEALRVETEAAILAAEHLQLRRHYVAGAGPFDPHLLFVGEAPGEQDEVNGRPFQGVPGEILTRLMSEAKIDPNTCHLTYLLKVRPAATRNTLVGPQEDNRRSTVEERALFIPFLIREISLINPKGIVALGATAAAVLTGEKDLRIMRARGDIYRYAPMELPVMVTYSPSYLQHRMQEHQGPLHMDVVSDMRRARLMV